MKETEVHGDDPPTTVIDALRHLTRGIVQFRREVLERLDRIEAAQSKPPAWLTRNWRDVVYVALILAALLRGDGLAGAGYLIGAMTGHPVVSTPAPAQVAPSESP